MLGMQRHVDRSPGDAAPTEHGTRHEQNLALSGLFVPSLLDSGLTGKQLAPTLNFEGGVHYRIIRWWNDVFRILYERGIFAGASTLETQFAGASTSKSFKCRTSKFHFFRLLDERGKFAGF